MTSLSQPDAVDCGERAILRRAGAMTAHEDATLVVGDLVMDEDSHEYLPERAQPLQRLIRDLLVAALG